MREVRPLLFVITVLLVACSPGPGDADPVPTAAPSTLPSLVAPTTSAAEPTTTSTASTSTSTTTTTTLPPLRGLTVETLAFDVGFPVGAKPVPGADAFVVIGKQGILFRFDGAERTIWLDITDLVRDSGEQGFLDFVFAPDFVDSGRAFAHYSAKDGSTTLAEFTLYEGMFDARTHVVVYSYPQPAANHNGGALAFAPDGTLLLALGDGGGAGDRYGNGQNVDTPLGGVVRFDVSTPGTAVPAGAEAFSSGGAPELWMYGLRNPWKVAIDDGFLYVADVGQAAYEEISVVPWDAAGTNFGWPVTEGLHCFDPPSGCGTETIELPIVEISHDDDGTCSISGGVVYRGSAIPELFGHYLFSDYCGGYLRSMVPGTGEVQVWDAVLSGHLGRVAGFGTDHNGELLILNGQGLVFRLLAER